MNHHWTDNTLTSKNEIIARLLTQETIAYEARASKDCTDAQGQDKANARTQIFRFNKTASRKLSL